MRRRVRRVLMLGDSYHVWELSRLSDQSYRRDSGSLDSRRPSYSGIQAISGDGDSIKRSRHSRHFAPQLRPTKSYVILGFYMNDFADNLYILSTATFRSSGSGQQARLFGTRQFYFFDTVGESSSRSNEVDSISFRDGKSIDRRANQFERQLGTTRLGTIVLRALDRLGSTLRTDVETLRRDKTREYLRELRNLAAQQNIKLLVLLIPSAKDLGAPGAMYQSAVQIMSELALSYMESDQSAIALQ